MGDGGGYPQGIGEVLHSSTTPTPKHAMPFTPGTFMAVSGAKSLGNIQKRPQLTHKESAYGIFSVGKQIWCYLQFGKYFITIIQSNLVNIIDLQLPWPMAINWAAKSIGKYP